MNRNKLCITVDEAAELASVAPAVIRQWAEDFDFPSMKIGQRGGKRLIHLDTILWKQISKVLDMVIEINHYVS